MATIFLDGTGGGYNALAEGVSVGLSRYEYIVIYFIYIYIYCVYRLRSKINTLRICV